MVLEFLLDILIPLEQLVVLDLPLLESLIHAGLDLLSECIHFVGLPLDQSSLGGHDLLVALLHVALALFLLHLMGLNLHLMGLCVLLLSCELLLDLLEVEELSGMLEGQGQFLLE